MIPQSKRYVLKFMASTAVFDLAIFKVGVITFLAKKMQTFFLSDLRQRRDKKNAENRIPFVFHFFQLCTKTHPFFSPQKTIFQVKTTQSNPKQFPYQCNRNKTSLETIVLFQLFHFLCNIQCTKCSRCFCLLDTVFVRH